MGRAKAAKGAILGGAMAAFLLLGPAVVSAQVTPAEVSAYQQELGATTQQAEDRLEIQDKGARSDIVETVEASSGSHYAGIWFDNETGEFVVPTLPGSDRSRVAREFATAGIADEFRTEPARFSWSALEAAHERIDGALLPLIRQGLVQTSLDPRTNAVVVDLARGIESGERGQVQRAIAAENVDVEVQMNAQRFSAVPQACQEGYDFFCGKPLRGGVRIEAPGVTCCNNIPLCSAGFKATGNTYGNRFLLTAGHCTTITGVSKFTTFDKDSLLWSEPREIGQVETSSFPVHDYAAINANGKYWDTSPWPAQVAYWGVDNSRAITNESSSFVGQQVCRAGAKTGASCGTVTAIDLTVNYSQGAVYNLTAFSHPCSAGGDSGGPIFAGNTALGIYSGISALETESEQERWEKRCTYTGYYSEITEVTDLLGVSVATRSTQTSIKSTSALNGNPGWFSISGEVHTPGGAPVSTGQVVVKLFKWTGSNWSEQAKLEAPVKSGSYAITNWKGVGPGQWLAKVVFPAQGGLGESTSNETDEGWFQVRDGYRLKVKKSGKCLDVTDKSRENAALLQQWDCLDPAVYQNQVFTLVPQATFGTYQLVARNSGRCVDVYNSSTSNGARLQQWDCGAQSNQIFRTEPAGSEAGLDYNYYVAKHSEKCIDVIEGSMANGAGVQQWGCTGVAQQKWALVSVDSAPVPTDTSLTVDGWLHGQPGYVFVSGNVKAGAYPLAGKQVKVEFDRESSPGNWENVPSETLTVYLDGAGHYEFGNWGIGVGTWRAHATFQGASGPPQLATSSSANHGFQIRQGYQFINRYSGKCMTLNQNGGNDGQAIIQWPCTSTSPGSGQVFRFAPQPNGYYNLIISSTGKCVDVQNASTADAAWLQQWSCLGAGQANQLWDKEPIQNNTGWFAFIAKHSGKCADLTGPSLEDGRHIQQWSCHWGSNQQWNLEPVG